MKNLVIAILYCLPFLALGQSKLLSSVLSNAKDLVEIRVETQLVSIIPSNKQIETTLIDDTRYYKSLLDFDFEKSYQTSFVINNYKSYSFSEGQNLEALQLKFNPTKTLDLQFSNPLGTRPLFDSKVN